MARCAAKTVVGKRCLNEANEGRDFCTAHKGHFSGGEVLAAGIGAIIGNAVMPGVGGLVIGGLVGQAGRSVVRESFSSKKKVFVSFDFENDQALKHFVVGQAKHPKHGFEIVDYSLKEAAPERKWKQRAMAAIKRSDIVLVIVGRNTHRAPGVLAEVKMARAADVRVVQVIGHRSEACRAVPGAGRLYEWNRENLRKLLA